LSSKNSGQIEEIFILGIEVFSKICSIQFAKFLFGKVFVFIAQYAAKFIQVITISFHQFFSKSKISLTILSIGRER